MDLRPFQRRFLRSALAPGIDTAALSLPWGNGKTWLASHVLSRCLDPEDELFVEGAEYLLCAGSIEQARLCFRFIRSNLEPTGEYRFIDSATRIGITHLSTFTRLRILSSNGKTTMGIVNCPVLVADEPGSWEVVGGTLMHDAIQTAQGKPGSPMKVIYIGTLAPATGGWWHDLIADGSHGSTYVQVLQGNPEKWDQWSEIRRCNPLTAISEPFRKKLLEERDAARADTRLKARFLSYRLNRPAGDESTMLLDVDTDWKRATERAVMPRLGAPIVGVDLGGTRSWSAACAIFQTGRIECLALAAGVPDLDEQEKRDRVPRGIYKRLRDLGQLHVAEGLRVQPPGQLWDAICQRWGVPVLVVCDRFRLSELQDAVDGACPVEPRVTRWSDASADIRATRRGFLDGPFTVAEDSRAMLVMSLARARVEADTSGNTRLIKRNSNSESRDDVVAALTLACGAFARSPQPDAEEVERAPILV